MRRLAIVITTAAGLLLAGCGGGGSKDDPAKSPSSTTTTEAGRSITGTISVGQGLPSEFRKEGGSCSTSSIGAGMEGYGDIAAGTRVVVKDGAGTILGTGALQAGHWKADILMTCEFPFTVGPLPSSDFYTLTIGRRGDQSYSRADLDQRNWQIDLKLG